MQCQKCEKNLATVHVTDIIDGVRNEQHLCEQCAQVTGLPFASSFSVSKFLGLMEAAGSSGGVPAQEVACPDCGMTLSEFRTSGRFGCARDYEVFREHLEPMLEKMHGATRHVGKHPDSRLWQVTERMQRLKGDLAEAITREAYEEAAELRDQIESIEHESATGTD